MGYFYFYTVLWCLSLLHTQSRKYHFFFFFYSGVCWFDVIGSKGAVFFVNWVISDPQRIFFLAYTSKPQYAFFCCCFLCPLRQGVKIWGLAVGFVFWGCFFFCLLYFFFFFFMQPRLYNIQWSKAEKSMSCLSIDSVCSQAAAKPGAVNWKLHLASDFLNCLWNTLPAACAC